MRRAEECCVREILVARAPLVRPHLCGVQGFRFVSTVFPDHRADREVVAPQPQRGAGGRCGFLCPQMRARDRVCRARVAVLAGAATAPGRPTRSMVLGRGAAGLALRDHLCSHGRIAPMLRPESPGVDAGCVAGFGGGGDGVGDHLGHWEVEGEVGTS